MAENGPTREDIAKKLRAGGPMALAQFLDTQAPVDRNKILDDLDSYREWQSFSPRLAKQRADQKLRDKQAGAIVVTVPDAQG